MKLALDENILKVKLNPLEMVFAMHSSLKVPVEHITSASTEKPGWEISTRAPGIHIPFLLKSGTYHTDRGREFWCTTIGLPYLVIDLQGWRFNRIVLTMSENKEWADRINGSLQ